MNRFVIPLAAALALGSVAVAAQSKPPTPTPAAASVTVAYAGQTWQIDPALGPVQGVVTRRLTDSDGTHLEGVVFLHDAGGWRAAGGFVEDAPNADLKDANVYAELKFVVVGN